jgi:mannose-6-phosphate isomerase-like protein (cupin superfamily)
VKIRDGANLINATVKRFEYDIHAYPETLISLKGAYAIETPDGEIAIPEGSAFTVPPGLKHRPANKEACVILVLS